MDEITQAHLKNIRASDKTLQNAAYTYLMAATETAVSLINTEADQKYRKKYAKLWPKAS
ncbi:MAG: hypothetical protein WAS33_07135 [Candidatus Promineifilaceae bacterium]|nr:hypothetical protein [Anaerolineaceae bacterium]